MGDYRLVRRLGAGAMGEVWEGQHVALGVSRAVKLLPPMPDAEALLRFRREAEAMASLNHPHVARVHAFGELPRPYLVMDLLSGGSLAEHLARGPLPHEQAVRLVCQLADGLDHMHRQGVLHRDIKPDNVLLDERGSPVWVDFGLAKLAASESLTQTGSLLGTPNYMAPEQANGELHLLSPRTDVYGLGALLYRCLTGDPPFKGKSIHGILTQLLTEPPTPIRELAPDVPPRVAAACERALEKAPEKRFASAAELADALQPPPAGASARTAWAGVALLLGAALLGAALLAAWRPAPAPPARAATPTPARPDLPPEPAAPSSPTRPTPRVARRVVLSQGRDLVIPAFDAGGRVLAATRESGLFVYETPGSTEPQRYPLNPRGSTMVEKLLPAPGGCLLACDEGPGFWIPDGGAPEPLEPFSRAELQPGGGVILGRPDGWARCPLPPTGADLRWLGTSPDPEFGVTFVAPVSAEELLVAWGRLKNVRPDDLAYLERYGQDGSLVARSAKTSRLNLALQPAAAGPWLAASSSGQIYVLPPEGVSPTPWDAERVGGSWDRRLMPHSIRGLAATARMVYALSPLHDSDETLLRAWSWPKGQLRCDRRFPLRMSRVALSPQGDWLALGARERGELWLLPLDAEGIPAEVD